MVTILPLRVTQPFAIEQNTISISCSVGIGIYPVHGDDVTTLMRVADNAMYQAKRAGRGCFRFYDPDMVYDEFTTPPLPDTQTQ